MTAERWVALLRELGHAVTVRQDFDGRACDLMIALHARKSFRAVRRYRFCFPGAPLIVALTGTDLYRDLARSRAAQKSVQWADRLVVLQPRAREALDRALRPKVRVIYQSATPVLASRADGCPGRPPRGARAIGSAGAGAAAQRGDTFDVCVLAHLRHEKDPLRAAMALRLLGPNVRVRVVHAGAALSPAWERRARATMLRERRYAWLGEIPRGDALRLLARSRLLVLTSRMEGGANVASEAIVNGIPIVASRIPGTEGLLGAGYPGYFPVGDTRALAALLGRAACDEAFCVRLARWCARLAPRFEPARERDAWRRLLRSIIR